MEDVREAVENFISEDSARITVLRTILTVDGRNEGWTDDDVPVDSEVLEDLITCGIVVRTEERLSVSDRTAVRKVLDAKRASGTALSRNSRLGAGDRALTLLGLIGALALLVGVRVVFIDDLVFVNGDILLAGNDPYYYLYWIEQLLNGSATLSLRGLAHLPERVENGDVLLFVTTWGVTGLFGGDPGAAREVLAWYPVVAALVTAILVYLFTVSSTADERAGVVAVTLLAITPVHAFRTALGFADHHAFDYAWLALTVLSVVTLSTEKTDGTWRQRTATATLGIGVVGQTLAWRGAPLLLLPIVLYAPLKASVDVRANRSPLVANRSLILGLGLGALLTYLTHLSFGWLPDYRVLAPTVLLGAVLVVFVVAEVTARSLLSERAMAALLFTALAFVVLAASVEFSDLIGELLGHHYRSRSKGIMESYPLFGSGWESVRRPLQTFGFVLFVAMPYLVWGSWVAYRERHPGLTAIGIYAWYFFLLSLVKLRFAGQLSLFVAPFAGVGIVHLATKERIRRRPIGFDPQIDRDRVPFRLALPSRRTVVVVLLVVLVVGSMGLLMSYVRMIQIGVQEETYETATWIDKYSDRNGIEYPDNYVLSSWGRNRVYNYLVNGQSRMYGYAQVYYSKFMASETPDKWVERFERSNRDGFIVTEDWNARYSNRSMHARLHNRLGSRGDGVPGVGHYRAVYVSDDGSTKVFEIVPGARLTMHGPPNTTVRVQTQIQIGGESRTYKRVGRTNRYGDYGVTVPYKGRYTVNGETRYVSETAVKQGEVRGTYRVHFPLDEGKGTNITDPVGGTRGTIDGASWERGVEGDALSFRQKTDFAKATGPALDVRNGSFSVSFWVKGNLSGSESTAATVLNGHNEKTGSQYTFFARNSSDDFCAQIRDDRGSAVANCGIGTTAFDKWTHIVGVFDRNADELRLYRNGTLVATRDTTSVGNVSGTKRLFIGSPHARYSTSMAVDDVRIYGRDLSQEEINHLHERLIEG